MYRPAKVSRFEADWTVRVSASRPADESNGEFLTLHFVNYNRTEPPKRNGKPSAGGGTQDEKPIETSPIRASIVLPPGRTVSQIRFTTPENEESVVLKPKISTGDDWRAEFTVPKFLVYGVANVKLKPVE